MQTSEKKIRVIAKGKGNMETRYLSCYMKKRNILKSPVKDGITGNVKATWSKPVTSCMHTLDNVCNL